MPTVTIAGKTYEAVATFGLLRRIRDVHGIDLLSENVPGFDKFITSPDDCQTVVAEFFGLTTEQESELADKMKGSDVAASIHAVTEALRDFFRESGWVDTVEKISKKYTLLAGGRIHLAKRIAEVDMMPELIKELDSVNLLERTSKPGTP